MALVRAPPESAPSVAEGATDDLAAAISAMPPRCAMDPRTPLPFEGVWVPALGAARRKLVGRLATGSSREAAGPLELTESAYASLEHHLLARLTELGEHALYREFRRERRSERELRLLFLAAPASSSTRRYEEFVRRLCAARLAPLFRRYRMLARLCATVVDQWVAATGELLERLARDAALVASVCGRADGDGALCVPQRVVAIRPGLSDPHDGGRTVATIQFASGGTVVYKPKPLATEAAFHRFVEWCNEHGAGPALRALRCLDRGDYGWEEYAEQRPCTGAVETRRFYERAGALLCVLHVLRVTDCHRENVVASGEFPVLVDGETVMHPDPRAGNAPAPRRRDGLDLRDSVLRTGLLPRWWVNAERRLVLDISALGGSERDQTRVATWRWHAMNSDDMYRAPDEVALPPSNCEPGLDGAAVEWAEHAEDLARGFTEAYRGLLAHRAALLAPGGPVESFRGLPVRVIVRPTAVYGAILRKALAPGCLEDGVTRSLALDEVSRAPLDEAYEPASAIVEAEVRSLERLDVPCFRVRCDGTDLPLGGDERILGCFTAPSLQQVVSRIESMSDADLDLQLAIVRGAFEARAARPALIERTNAPDQRERYSPPMHLSARDLVGEAMSIARLVLARARDASGGALYWLGLREIEGASRFQLAMLDDSLYDGNGGIAIFLAAAARVSGAPDLRLGSLGALARVRARLRDPRAARSLVEDGAIGGGHGLGSIVYALATVVDLLGERALLPDAIRASRLFTDELIREPFCPDVVAGAAGAILGLLAAERASGAGIALERATACAKPLLERRVAVGAARGAWRNGAGNPLTGFAHGAAGIAYALLRLYEVTGDGELLDAASEGIAYERSVFDTDLENWPDFREHVARDGERCFALGWCSGAPGIGLARLGGLRALDDAAVRDEIDAALRTTLRSGAGGVDHLCCGTMGRAETLAVAAAKLERRELREAAAAMAAAVVARARESGGYRFPGGVAGEFHPSLFSGLSGIGYELLRLARPDDVPSVLLWE